MKSAFRIILALSLPLVACGQSKPDLFLDQTTTALECASSSDPDCSAAATPPHHSGEYADAGAPSPRMDECYADDDCEYGEVCQRRHGVSLCQPEDEGHHGGHDDGYGGSGGDDDGYDDSSGGRGGDGSAPDAGSAGCAGDDHPKGSDDCSPDGDDHGGDDADDDRYEDRSGSNSGPH
ncbi:MAG TPA: hypothetical protein VMG12_41780 [Polyangiaceae bacterium]|nr:hypothetical protein [Polyangiaceae bacterium]